MDEDDDKNKSKESQQKNVAKVGVQESSSTSNENKEKANKKPAAAAAAAPAAASQQQSTTSETQQQQQQQQPAPPVVEFPVAKFAVTIITPRVVELEETKQTEIEEWEEFSNRKSEAGPATKTTTTVVNLHLLLVSLLNRLIKGHVFPRNAVEYHLNSNIDGYVVVHILTPSKALPVLTSKCEHLGIGNVVGIVYACPLETYVIPEIGEHSFEEIVPYTFTNNNAVDQQQKQKQQAAAAAADNSAPTKPGDKNTSSQAPLAKKESTSIDLLPVVKTQASAVASEEEKNEVAISTSKHSNESSDNEKPPELVRSNSHPEVMNRTFEHDTKDKKKKKNKGESVLEEIPKPVVLAETDKKDSNTNASSENIVEDDIEAPSTTTITKTKLMKDALVQKVIDARKEWLATASRVRVEQVAEEVTAAAALTWDYMAFVVCAAAISAVGLATDSSVTVLASMLVSPIMGPILSITLGTMIRRSRMIKIGLRNECISILLCLIMGAFGGIIAAFVNIDEIRDWPSDEMTSRGDITGLVAGVLVALPSGVATALSTLGKNSSGLVGVAISLSLLPPAVNAGLCWTYALLLNAPSVNRNEGDQTNYWVVGSLSLILTLVNIVCIWVAGVFTFWLKEVAPIKRKNAFWSRDIKVARAQGANPVEPDVGKLASGIQAAIDLKAASGEMGDPDGPSVIWKREASNIGSMRRRGLSSSKLEDALFLDGDFGMKGKVIAGGAARQALPPNLKQIPPGSRLKKAASESLIRNTQDLGGLEKAGEVLFDDRIFAIGEERTIIGDEDICDYPSDAGVDYDDTVNAILYESKYR